MKATTSKKKKTLDLSFLPTEIQSALTSGANAFDSDDDDINQTKSKIATSLQNKLPRDVINNELLALLPNPTNTFDNDINKQKTNNNASDHGNNNVIQNNITKSSTLKVVPPTAALVTTVHKNPSNKTQTIQSNAVNSTNSNSSIKSTAFSMLVDYGEDDDDDDRNSESEETVSETNLNFDKAIEEATRNIPKSNVDINSAPVKKNITHKFPLVAPLPKPTLDHAFSVPISNLIDKSSNVSSTLYNSYSSFQLPTKIASSNISQTNNQHIQPITYAHDYSDNSSSNAHSNRKKRDRDIEIQLMNGDLSVINNEEVKTTEINASRSWDSEKYKTQLEREAMVYKEFNFNGATSANQPTKTQNRKHQLNSLLFKAAETELALLESRGNRSKSKSETQGKYGW
eukprot:gene9942-13375_t